MLKPQQFQLPRADSFLLLKYPIIIVTLLLIIVFFIFSLSDFFGQKILPQFYSYDRQRILELVFLISIFLLTLSSTNQYQQFYSVINYLPKVATKILFFILIMGFFSSFFAPLPSWAFLEYSLFILLFGFSFAIAAQRKTLGEKYDVIIVNVLIFVITGYVFSFIFSLSYFAFGTPLGLYFSSFMNLRFFSEFQIASLSLLAIPICNHEEKLKLRHYVLFLLLALWWSLAILNGSKSLWLSCLIAFSTVGLLYKKSALPFIRVQALAVLTGLSFSFLLLKIHEKLIHLSSAYIGGNIIPLSSAHIGGNINPLGMTFSSRILMFQQAINLIKKHPFFGIGPMHFAYYSSNYAANPHNAIFLIAVEWGIPICFAVIGLILVGCYFWFKKNTKQKENSFLHVGLSAAIISTALNTLTGSAIVTPLSQIMIFMLLGWSLGIFQAQKIIKAPIKEVTHANFSCLVLLFSLFASCIFTIKELYFQVQNLTHREQEWYFLTKYFNPRFWVQGWIY